MTKRDIKQKEIVDLVIAKAIEDNHLHHLVIAATGIGKSKIAMDIIIQLKKVFTFKKILILVDNTRLRDYNWKDDFEKWDLGYIYNDEVEMNTYQTAYKWTKSLDDYLIICDEADFSFTPEYGKFYETYRDNLILGLTGYVTEDKRSFMDSNLPCLIEYTAEAAQQQGILNSTPIVFVKFDLGKARTVKVTYGEDHKVFYQSENEAYDYWDSRVRRLYGELEDLKVELNFTHEYKARKKLEKEIVKLENGMRWSATKRSELLINLDSSADMARRLIAHTMKEDNSSKIISFSKRKAQCNKITRYTYHGGNKDDINDKNFDDFNEGTIRELGLVDKINRGVNMVNLDYALFESYYGSDTKLRQRLGRLMRLNPDDLATMYVLLPYFMRKVRKKIKEEGKPDRIEISYKQAKTKSVDWAVAMFEGWDLSEAKTWDYRTIKSDL